MADFAPILDRQWQLVQSTDEWEKIMGSKRITVDLDPLKSPAVQIDPGVLGQSKIQWIGVDNPSTEFSFTDFQPRSGGVFTKVVVANDKITAVNDMNSPGDHEYTITVADKDGNPYDSTVDFGPLTGDKPVIRN